MRKKEKTKIKSEIEINYKNQKNLVKMKERKKRTNEKRNKKQREGERKKM